MTTGEQERGRRRRKRAIKSVLFLCFLSSFFSPSLLDSVPSLPDKILLFLNLFLLSLFLSPPPPLSSGTEASETSRWMIEEIPSPSSSSLVYSLQSSSPFPPNPTHQDRERETIHVAATLPSTYNIAKKMMPRAETQHPHSLPPSLSPFVFLFGMIE